MRWLSLLITHGVAIAIGFALGVYLLPILTAPPSVERAMLEEAAREAQYKTSFSRALKGSDFLHWGEGEVSITASKIVHNGALAPGPNYKLYLTPKLVETEEAFQAIKDRSVAVGDVRTFDGFILDVPSGVDVNAYSAVVIWCEAFNEFITAAQYR